MSDRILVGSRKGLFVWERKSAGWEVSNVHFLGDQVPMLLADSRDGAWYAGRKTDHFGQKLFRSENQGGEWTEVAVPKYGEGDTFGGQNPDGSPGKPKPASLSLIWDLAAGGADQPGGIWAGTVPGGLFRSNDRGESWELVRGLWDHPSRGNWFGGGMDDPGIHSVCVHPQDSKHVTIGVSCGGAWVTRDDGKTWECKSQGMRAEYMPPDMAYNQDIQDPHIVVQCQSDPNALWVQHHNGIFRSTDGAESWTEMENAAVSAFGFAAAVHPGDGKTAWFVPGVKDACRIAVGGKLVVTKTKDGGESWQEQRNGLPQENCYDIVFRHGLAIDETGDRLAMGSSTGGFWLTEDGGETWTNLGSHLPQIYCVRFG